MKKNIFLFPENIAAYKVLNYIAVCIGGHLQMLSLK